MKKPLLFALALLSATVGFSQNSVPNGNFENWITVPFMEPLFYETGNGYSATKNQITTERVTDAFHGSYAVKMITKSTSTDTLTAYMANGDPGNPVGQGIPYSEMATGLRGYYKSAIMPGDSANIFVFFKKNGTMIGQYIFKLTGTQSNYTLFNFNFVPALPLAPDTMIWGATPSNVLSSMGSFNGIPGSMLQLDSLSFTGAATQPVFMNGDFESWVSDSALVLPGWQLDETGNTRTTDAYAGLYAAQLETTLQNWGVQNGFMSTGESTQTGTIGGTPFTNQQDTLAFYYKYTPGDVNDSASVNLMLKFNGNYILNIGKRLPAAATYTYVEIPFNAPQAPDTAIININSSRLWPTPPSYVGSLLKIDDIHYKSQMVPVANFNAPDTVCAHEMFTLVDASTQSPSGWMWTMPGASPSSSNQSQPMAHYASAGTYTVTLVASNGAGQSAPVSKQIVVLTQPVIGYTVTPNDTVCAGTQITLTGTGSPNSSWSGGITDNAPFTALNSTSYVVTGTAGNGCSNTDTVMVVVNQLPNVSFNLSPNDTICSGTNILLSGTGAVSYTWSGGVTDNVQYMVNSSSAFVVTGTDANGCMNTDTASIFVDVCTGVENLLSETQVVVYPNPFTEGATVQLGFSTQNNTFMNIYDITGRQVVNAAIPANISSLTITREDLENGIYFIRIIRDEAVISTAKVVIE